MGGLPFHTWLRHESRQKGAKLKKQLSKGDTGQKGLNFFQTSLFLALTIGIPFCTFKYLFGALAIRYGWQYHQSPAIMLGWVVIGWAGVDFLMNLVRIYLNLQRREIAIEFCLIAQLGRLIKRPSLFLTIDTFLSFGIICFVLWSGWIRDLRPYETYMWYAATTINLMGLALMNILTEFRINSDRKENLASHR